MPAGEINHHWTKGLVASPDGRTLFVSVGSNSDHGENGIDAEAGRAAIWAIDPATGATRVFASGLRNPVGMDFEPRTGTLWTVVNERDELGGDLVPDYLTSVQAGSFYGWPYSYYGDHLDPRVDPQRPDLVAQARVPDYALGPHGAPLGLTFADGAKLGPRFTDGAFIGQHGSWNRKPQYGYRVIFVPFRQGRPAGPPVEVLTGFPRRRWQRQGPTCRRCHRQAWRSSGGRRRRQRRLAGQRGIGTRRVSRMGALACGQTSAELLVGKRGDVAEPIARQAADENASDGLVGPQERSQAVPLAVLQGRLVTIACGHDQKSHPLAGLVLVHELRGRPALRRQQAATDKTEAERTQVGQDEVSVEPLGEPGGEMRLLVGAAPRPDAPPRGYRGCARPRLRSRALFAQRRAHAR